MPKAPAGDGAASAPLVVAVLLNWRNSDDTLACLAQLARADYPRLEVVVVDNGSGDGSAERIAAAFPGVPLVRSPENRGFAGGANQGIQYAAARGADFALLLNSDVTFAPDMISRLVAGALARPEAGILSPKLYQDAGRTLWMVGFRITRGGVRALGLGEPDRGQHDGAALDAVPGCAMLIARRTWERIGLLDERFFFFGEDIDYGARARQAGLTVELVPGAQLRHDAHGATRASSGRRQFLLGRARALLLRKHRRRFSAPRLVLSELIETLRICLWSARYGDARAIAGYLGGLCSGAMGRAGERARR